MVYEDREGRVRMHSGTKFGLWIGLPILATLIVGWLNLKTIEVPVGYEAVLTMKPYLIGERGVYGEPVTTGRTWVWTTTSPTFVITQPRQFAIHFEDLMSSDGVPLDFDAVIRLQVTHSVDLIKTFGPKWYENNVEAELRNRVRQSVRKHGMNETAISTTAIEEIDNEISVAIEQYVKTSNLPVRLIQVTVGRANPPDSLKERRVQTAAAEQQTIIEGKNKLAYEARILSEKARAQSDVAYMRELGLSPAQFIELERIKMLKTCAASQKCTMIAGAEVAPVVNVAR